MAAARAREDTGEVTREIPSWTLVHTEWDDPRAEALRSQMDAELGARYAERFEAFDAETRARFDRHFAVDPATIVAVVLVLDDEGDAVGHAAVRALGDELEVKRVFVHASARGTGASRALMSDLESIGAHRGARRLILQTGDRQQDAETLYTRIGYRPIPIFAPYIGFDFSRCYEKPLVPAPAVIR